MHSAGNVERTITIGGCASSGSRLVHFSERAAARNRELNVSMRPVGARQSQAATGSLVLDVASRFAGLAPGMREPHRIGPRLVHFSGTSLDEPAVIPCFICILAERETAGTPIYMGSEDLPRFH